MEATNLRFLEALRAALQRTQVNWTGSVDFSALFLMGEKHHLLPLIYEAVYTCPAAKAADPQLLAQAKGKTIQTVTVQTMKTSDFHGLYSQLRARGLRPLVVKGLVCRQLYPDPDYRISSDEDLLVPPEQFDACRAAMAELGMECAEAEPDPDSYEIPYRRPGGALYVELHRQLFPPKSEAYGELSGYFSEVFSRAVPLAAEGGEVWTLAPTDHLFYLICHAFKHFLHSGFGIRQVCDIVLFANAYGRDIHWEEVLENCRAIRAERFAAALFRMGEAYLTFDPAQACWPRSWQEIDVDYQPMLDDLLDAGVFGAGSMSRRHSSHLTLSAMASQKRGRATSGILQSLFPPADSLSGRYPYLKGKPWLLPVAWGSRFLKYSRETRKTTDNDAASAIRIGNQRIELLREYGIIDR